LKIKNWCLKLFPFFTLYLSTGVRGEASSRVLSVSGVSQAGCMGVKHRTVITTPPATPLTQGPRWTLGRAEKFQGLTEREIYGRANRWMTEWNDGQMDKQTMERKIQTVRRRQRDRWNNNTSKNGPRLKTKLLQRWPVTTVFNTDRWKLEKKKVNAPKDYFSTNYSYQLNQPKL